MQNGRYMKQFLEILILEDNPTDVEMLLRVLEKAKFQFHSRYAMTKAEYLAMLDERIPDLILSDNSMLGFDASEALEIYHQRNLSVPFILVTGTVSEEFAAGIIKQGADDYFLKDRLTRLPSAIENALAKRKANQKNIETIEKLRDSEKNLSSIFENTSEGFILTDHNFIIKAFNENAGQFSIYFAQAGLLVGQDLFAFILPSRIGVLRGLMERVISGERFEFDRFFEKENVPSIWLHITLRPVYAKSSISGVCVTAKNITDRKNAEMALIESQKRISREIIKAQENEKNYLGQELHDNVNQILAGVKIYLDKVQKDHPECAGSLDYPLHLIDISMQEIRKLCKGLVTSVSNIKLEELIRLLLYSLKKNLELQTEFDFEISREINEELSLNLYRITQELLNNIVKYSKANKVRISLKNQRGFIHLSVEDNGVGFDIHQKRNGIGISNMMNRVATFGGKFDIVSSPGNGCLINIHIPV